MAVGVNIISDFDSKGITKAIQQFRLLETNTEKAAFALKKAFLPALAVLGGLAVAGFKAAQAAAADEVEQAKLAQTLQKVVGASAETVASTETMIASMSKASGTADTELRAALSSLVVGSGSLTKSLKGLALAQDVATASGAPLSGVADALAKAYAGNYKALQKLSPALRDLIKEGASTEVVFQQLNNTFGGATAAAADTAAGRMKILKNDFSELQESLGTALLPALESITNALIAVMGFIEEHKTTVAVLATTFVSLATAIVAFNLALSISKIVLMAFGKEALVAQAAAAPIALTVGLIVLAVIALAIAVIYVIKHFEGFKKVVEVVVNAVIGAWEWMVNMVIKAINKLISIINKLTGAFGFLGIDIPKIAPIAEQTFGRIDITAKKTTQSLFTTSKSVQQLGRELDNLDGGGAKKTGVSVKQLEANVKAATLALANMRAQGTVDLEALKDATDALSKAQADLTLATGKAAASASSGGGVVATAAEKLTKYIDAIKGVTSAQRSLRDANKSVDESNKNLLEKTKALTEAQKQFNLVTKGYGKESKESKDADNERSKAERTAERAKYALEQAVYAVKDAEKALADLRKDPEATPQKIRQAEISLAESKLSVADATDTQRDSTEALTVSQQKLDEAVNGAKEGSVAYKDALNDLLNAEKEQRGAIDERTTAYERLRDATDELAAAEKKRREAGKDVPAADKKKADAAQTAIKVVADTVTKVIETVTAVVPVVSAVVGAVVGGLTKEVLDQLNERRGIGHILSGFGGGGGGIGGGGGGIGGGLGEMFAFAKGGIVTSPMMGMVGEAGSEAVIPLDRLSNMGDTYNITVTAGMGADGKDIGTQIVNALKRYERTNGSIPISVA